MNKNDAETGGGSTTIQRHIDGGQVCCDPEWEAAYERFETPEEEITKFLGRLGRFGLDRADKQSRVIELFCGRGGGLVALERLGFQRLEGVDLSESLLLRYQGPARLHLADCRSMPLEEGGYDIAIVQGGLHHLPSLPDDFEAVLMQVRKLLRPSGRFYVVEPWMTPFLRFAHAVTDRPLVRRFYAKGDALATMTEHERTTYEQWLGMPETLIGVLERHFEPISKRIGWGKLMFVGTPRKSE